MKKQSFAIVIMVGAVLANGQAFAVINCANEPPGDLRKICTLDLSEPVKRMNSELVCNITCRIMQTGTIEAFNPVIASFMITAQQLQTPSSQPIQATQQQVDYCSIRARLYSDGGAKKACSNLIPDSIGLGGAGDAFGPGGGGR